MYRIREVDSHDDFVVDTLTDLHSLAFFDSASIPDFEDGHWWLTFHHGNPVGFAGVIPSTRVRRRLFFPRRCAQEALWTRSSVAFHAGDGIPRP